MIKALLFDFNGVLILDKPDYQSSKLESSIYQTLGTSLQDETDIQTIIEELRWDNQQFWDYIAQTWNAVIPNMELIQWIKSLKKRGYKTALVSNTSGMIFRRNQEKFFGFNLEDIFDEIIISSEVKMLKPNKDIYEYSLNKLNVSPQESIMIDDSNRYLRGATEVGMNVVHFENNENLKKDLQKINVEVFV